MAEAHSLRIYADFNGLFGQLLCLTHSDSCLDREGHTVLLREGMQVTAYDEDVDEHGQRDDLIASGTVQRSPEWLRCSGSRWSLAIDANGVRHESDLIEERE
jgi:hypothetical protein